MHITQAQHSDAETLVRIQIAAFHHDAVLYPGLEPDGPPGYDSVDEMQQKIAQDLCYKMVHEGQIIGGLVVFDMGAGHYHLDVIFIDPAQHGRGFGTQAMLFIEQAHPAARWTLDTPQWALRNQHFYEKLGYVRVREFEHDDGTPLIAYEKVIVGSSFTDSLSG